MTRRVPLYLSAVTVMTILAVAVAVAAEMPKTFDRVAYTGKVIVDKPVELGFDHGGVKFQSITFSGNEALIIVWNRMPKAVKGNVGIALFDEKNRLIAAESDSQSVTRALTSIRAGKQTAFKVKFKKFISDFKEVASYRLVFVIAK